MNDERIMAEHAEPKNGAGTPMTGAEAKRTAKRKHRQSDEAGEGGRSLDEWGDLDQFSAHASLGVLRHMTEDEDAAALPWESLRPK